MPTAPDSHDAHDYAERTRERFPRRLQELREACGLSMYAVWLKCGVSRNMSSPIEGGESIPTLHVAARLAHGVEKTLTEFGLNPNSPTSSGTPGRCSGTFRRAVSAQPAAA